MYNKCISNFIHNYFLSVAALVCNCMQITIVTCTGLCVFQYHQHRIFYTGTVLGVSSVFQYDRCQSNWNLYAMLSVTMK